MHLQSNDMVLLQQMGLSEEEQLKLALELSMQGESLALTGLCCRLPNSRERQQICLYSKTDDTLLHFMLS